MEPQRPKAHRDHPIKREVDDRQQNGFQSRKAGARSFQFPLQSMPQIAAGVNAAHERFPALASEDLVRAGAVGGPSWPTIRITLIEQCVFAAAQESAMGPGRVETRCRPPRPLVTRADPWLRDQISL